MFFGENLPLRSPKYFIIANKIGSFWKKEVEYTRKNISKCLISEYMDWVKWLYNTFYESIYPFWNKQIMKVVSCHSIEDIPLVIGLYTIFHKTLSLMFFEK